jgi:hypothetical protein
LNARRFGGLGMVNVAKVPIQLRKTVRNWEKMMFLQRSRPTRTEKAKAGGFVKKGNVGSRRLYESFRNEVVLNSVFRRIAGY